MSARLGSELNRPSVHKGSAMFTSSTPRLGTTCMEAERHKRIRATAATRMTCLLLVCTIQADFEALSLATLHLG